jgi:hypothetical protein
MAAPRKKLESEHTDFDLISFYMNHDLRVIVMPEFENIIKKMPPTDALSETNYKNRVKSIFFRRIFLKFIYDNSNNVSVKRAILNFKKEEEEFLKKIVDNYNSRNE